ncbi:MAG: BrnT family toxin [Planctomycetota bacterium]
MFLDEDAVQFFDEPHSSAEERYLMLGMSSRFRLLLVAHAFREDDSVIRTISARRATTEESKHYTGRKP